MEPIDCVERWNLWRVRGTPAIITKVIKNLDANLPPEWKRLHEEELEPYQSLVRPGSVWYSLETAPGWAGMVLNLEMVRDFVLQGGRTMFAGPPDSGPSSNIRGAWNQLMKFLDERITPAARFAGAEIWMPSLADLFTCEVPSDIVDSLRRFSQAARKTLPLNPKETELWEGFVIAAFHTRTIIDDRRFVNWLVFNGWGTDDAVKLSDRFTHECQFLMRYKAEVTVA